MTSMSASVTIGIAIVEHDDQFLIGTRPEGTPLAGYAEFPGGKCRPRESIEDCVRRECLEETGFNVTPLRRLHRCEFEYDHGAVDLHFWLCQSDRSNDGEPAGAFRWVARDQLGSLRFPEANTEVVKLLKLEKS